MTLEAVNAQPLSELSEDIEEMASLEHGSIGALLSSYLVQYVYANGLGRVFDSQTSFKVPGNPPTRRCFCG